MIPIGRTNCHSVDPIDRVRELTWAVIDDNIDDAEWIELQNLLAISTEARLAYIEAIQLHTELQHRFQDRKHDSNNKSAAVLSFLGDSAGLPTPTFEMG